MAENLDDERETREEIPLVDDDIDVDEAIIVLKLIFTPFLYDISAWIRDSVRDSFDTLSKYR